MSCEGVEVDGACILHCDTEGEVRCDSECIDPATNADFCGATEACQDAGNECESDESCVLGACRSWGKEESLGPFLYSSTPGDVALVMDHEGTATLSYNESLGALVVKRRVPGGPWSSAHTLDNDVSSISDPKLAVDGGGNVLAIWANEGFGHGWARYRAKAASWGLSAALDLGTPESDPHFGSPAAMAAAPSGDVFIGFDNGAFASGTEAWTRRFGIEADGWFNPVRHDENGTDGSGFGALVIDADSNVTITWTESSATASVARASHWNAADNRWSAPTELGSGLSGLRGAADAEGNVALVSCSWTTIVPHNYNRAEGSWSTDPALVDDPDATIVGCTMASNSAGEMMLAWSQKTPDEQKHRVSHRNPVTGTWQGATNIMDVPNGSSTPVMGMDAAGNTWVVANLSDTEGSKIIGRRYDAQRQAWEKVITIASATEPTTMHITQLSVSQSGSAIVVWSYEMESLWARAYE